jgi:hypothetical protein
MEALLKEIAVAFQVEEDTSRPVRSSRVQTPPPSTDS